MSEAHTTDFILVIFYPSFQSWLKCHLHSSNCTCFLHSFYYSLYLYVNYRMIWLFLS